MTSLPVQVEVKANRTAVVSFKLEASESIPVTIPYLFSGEAVSLHQGFLVWLPFSLPHTKVCVEGVWHSNYWRTAVLK